MGSPKEFDRFSILPTELRLQIYSHALPRRLLQLGYDFPFPFLSLPHHPNPITTLSSSQRDQCLSPIRTSVPALFHVCHESRHLCLSTYVPFAYTYAHPQNDTLYISSFAALELHCNINWYYKCARPPLYPLALLDRVAVEFDWPDLPLQAWTTGGWLDTDNSRFLYASPLLENYLAAFAEFGAPKQLIIVGGASAEQPQKVSTTVRGWKKIELAGDSNTHEPGKSEAVLQYIYDQWYYRREESSWFRE